MIMYILIIHESIKKILKKNQDTVAEWLAYSTHDLVITGSRLTAAAQ